VLSQVADVVAEDCLTPLIQTAHGSQKALVENYRPTLPSAVLGLTRV
jgi:hypothetical protein